MWEDTYSSREYNNVINIWCTTKNLIAVQKYLSIEKHVTNNDSAQFFCDLLATYQVSTGIKLFLMYMHTYVFTDCVPKRTFHWTLLFKKGCRNTSLNYAKVSLNAESLLNAQPKKLQFKRRAYLSYICLSSIAILGSTHEKFDIWNGSWLHESTNILPP